MDASVRMPSRVGPATFALFSIAVALVWGAALSASAITFQTVQFTTGGGAPLVWGQSVTLNVGATVPDSSIPAIVSLEFAGFRTGDPSLGSPGRTSVYLHVYDDFTITPAGDVATVGNLLSVSTNALDLEALPAATDASWFFPLPNLAKDVEYHFVFANNTSAATTLDPSNLVYTSMVTGISNPHTGGQSYNQAGDLGSGPTSEDLFFRIISSTPIPEPGTALLMGFGLAGLSRSGRRR